MWALDECIDTDTENFLGKDEVIDEDPDIHLSSARNNKLVDVTL